MDKDDTFYVCNPILGEYIMLPPTNWHSQNWWRIFSGIGYSATTNEYKVLRTSSIKKSELSVRDIHHRYRSMKKHWIGSCS
ncbi:hypothetical protein ACFX2A_022412 [Malus domestica]